MKNQKTPGGSGTKGAARAAPKAKPAKADPRTVPAPTAPASVAAKAVEAIAAIPAVAEAAPKKPEPKAAATKAVGKPAPVASKPAPVAARPVAPAAQEAPPLRGVITNAEKAIAPLATALEAGADQARAAYARAQNTGDSLRNAVQRSSAATTRGLAEINGKVLDLIRVQNEAAIDIWRLTLTAPSLSEAVRAHTSGLRQAYDATAAQWKEIAETAGRVMGEAAKPLHSALTAGR
jgi:hypothetical protein